MLWHEVQPGAYVTDGQRLLEVVYRNRTSVDLVDCMTDQAVVLEAAKVTRLVLVRPVAA